MSPLSTPMLAMRSWLPDGRALPDADWAARHRVMRWVLAAHVPAVVAYAVLTGNTPLHALVEASPAAVLLLVAWRARSRLVSSLGVALGLITCSAVFVHLSGGLIEWHFHYFVTLALVALYQEWRVYALALVFVVVQHALGSWLRFNDVYNHGNGELWWALVHGAFVLAASACHVASWRFHEIANERAESYRRELHDGEQSVMSLAAQAAEIRSDLIASASHEFRSPLTAIKGAATTLERYGERLSADERVALLASITDRSDRLSRLLESMLIASQVEPADGTAVTSLGTVLAETVGSLPPEHRAAVRLTFRPDLTVSCSHIALRQLLERLISAAMSRRAGTDAVRVTAHAAHSDEVVIEVRTPVGGVSADALRGVLDPFWGPASGARGTWAEGLNFYAVRRIAEVHGGSLAVRVVDAAVVMEVRLPQAAPLAPEVPEQVAVMPRSESPVR